VVGVVVERAVALQFALAVVAGGDGVAGIPRLADEVATSEVVGFGGGGVGAGVFLAHGEP